jgi:hypothetical protein
MSPDTIPPIPGLVIAVGLCIIWAIEARKDRLS